MSFIYVGKPAGKALTSIFSRISAYSVETFAVERWAKCILKRKDAIESETVESRQFERVKDQWKSGSLGWKKIELVSYFGKNGCNSPHSYECLIGEFSEAVISRPECIWSKELLNQQKSRVKEQQQQQW